MGSDQGLEEFLEHIQRHPYNDILIERFHALIDELQPDAQRRAVEKLLAILLDANPYAALRSCQRHWQGIRRLGASVNEQILALKMTQSCFQKLGRRNHVILINEEIAQLAQAGEGTKTLTGPKVEVIGAHDQASLHVVKVAAPAKSKPTYDDVAKRAFENLKEILGNFPSNRSQRLALSKLVKGFDQLYLSMGPFFAQALQQFGQNPLLWTREGEMQAQVRLYFLASRLFNLGKDPMTELRIHMCLEVLTAYFDQKLLLPTRATGKVEQQLRFEILEEALFAIIEKEILLQATEGF